MHDLSEKMEFLKKDPVKIYDARWESTDFTESEIQQLFRAIFCYATEIGVDTLVFARDARLGCAGVMEIGIPAAVKAGFRVVACFDPISTPLSYFLTMLQARNNYQTMGLTITASHNPKQYIGIKFTVQGVRAIGYDCGPIGGLTRVKELYHTLKDEVYPIKPGILEIAENPTNEYIRFTKKLSGVTDGSLMGIRLVLDCFNGSAGPEIYRALADCGVEIIPFRLVPNGNFPTGSPNPTSQNKMDYAVQQAKEQNADLVIGLDGDGDRIVFGDENGIFSAGFVMIPILRSILQENQQKEPIKILYDPKVNPVALAIWSELHANPILFRNGHSQIKGYMHACGALAAAEESGHYYHRFNDGALTISGENSLFTILLFLKAFKENPFLVKQLRELQNEVYTSGEFNYEFVDDEQRDKALAAVLQFFQEDGASLTTKSNDGSDLEGTVVYQGINQQEHKLELRPGWYSAYIRVATNEKGVVRSYLSSGNHAEGTKIKDKIVYILEYMHNGKEIE